MAHRNQVVSFCVCAFHVAALRRILTFSALSMFTGPGDLIQTLIGQNFGHAEESLEQLQDDLALAVQNEDFLSKTYN